MAKTIADTGFAARRKSYDLLVQKVEAGSSLNVSELTAMTRFEEELDRSGMDIPDTFATPDEVAEYTGYKVRTIYNAVKKGNLARLADSSFSREEVDRYLATKGRLPQVASWSATGGENEDDMPENGGARYEETRYRKARADKEELLVAKLQGKQVDVSEVNRQFTIRAHEYKTSLLLLSRRCAHLIAAAAGVEIGVVADILDSEAVILLKALSRKVELNDD